MAEAAPASALAPETETFLNDVWTLYFHDPYDDQWTPSSYKSQTTISTAEDWIKVNRSFGELWPKGMFFLMREHIQPLWEDPCNKNGGCFSYKVNKPDVPAYWVRLGAKLISDSIAKNPDHVNNVCGISVIPKRNYCILRIWISSNKLNKIDLYDVDIPGYTLVMYKSHEENSDFEAKST